MVLMSALIAMEIVLSRFLSFSVWNMKIGLAFAPVVVAAILLGPIKAGIVGAIADFLGAILFPIGTYFPGFTFTAFLTGMVFGLFLYKKQSLPNILAAVGINLLVLSLFLQTFWISVLYNANYMAVLVSRLTQVAILIPVQVVVITLISKTIVDFRRRRESRNGADNGRHKHA